MTRREKPVATPRLSREGWVPACPDRRVSSGMLIPKPVSDNDDDIKLASLPITAFERGVLREIVEVADVVTDGPFTYLIARVSKATLDVLAAFEADRADRNMDHDEGDSAYSGDADLEIEHDNEPEPESVSTPEFDPDKPVSRPTRIPGTLG